MRKITTEKVESVTKQVIKSDKDKLYLATTYEEDYAGGSRMYIREDLVESIVKICVSEVLKDRTVKHNIEMTVSFGEWLQYMGIVTSQDLGKWMKDGKEYTTEELVKAFLTHKR